MDKNALISILIPAYNAAATLEAAVKSVLAQTYENLEILIVDDGSADDTRKVAESLKKTDPRIKVIGHTRRKGTGAARNTALRVFSGDYVLFLDADDTLEPFGIARALETALRYDADYVDSFEIVQVSGGKGPGKPFTEGPLPSRTKAFGSLRQSPKIADLYFYCKGKLLRKDLVRGVFFDEDLPLYEDLVYDLTLKLKLKNYVFLKTPFYRYRTDIRSAVNRCGTQHLSYTKAIGRILPAVRKEPPALRDRILTMLFRNALFTILFKLPDPEERPLQRRQVVRDALRDLSLLLPESREDPGSFRPLRFLLRAERKSSLVLSLTLTAGACAHPVRLYYRYLSCRFPFREEERKKAPRKIRIGMLSMADSVEGQGVGSAYLELLGLLKERGKKDFEIPEGNKVRDADILHIHTVEPKNLLKMKLSKKPVIVSVHFLPDTLDGSIRLPGFAFSVFKRYVLYFYRSADVLVTVNPTFIPRLTKYGIPREKIEYIPNFVSRREFRKLSPERKKAIRKKLRQRYGIPEEAFLVLGCGQVQTRKGVADFAETAKLLPEVRFLWAGGFSFGRITDGYEELRHLVKNPPENVTFTGILPRSKMNALYNASDLLFVPSRNELFPMTILEAVSSGTPLLLRSLPLYQPILSGNYLSADDNEEFAYLIDRLRYDRELYESASAGSARICEKYSEERVFRKWKEFYERIYRG